MDVPRSSDARTPERIAYDQWHAWQGVGAEPDAIWHRMVIRHLLPARDLGGRRVLEMACGRGGFSYWLATQVLRPRQLVSADFSQVAVDKGASFAARHDVRIAFEVCDITRLAHPDAAFDTVISCETIEHVPEPQQAIAELARVLAPGGRLVAATMGPGMMHEIWDLVADDGTTPDLTFSSTNGHSVLGRQFLDVERRDLRGTAVFPDREAVLDYMRATLTRAHLAEQLPAFVGSMRATTTNSVFIARTPVARIEARPGVAFVDGRSAA